MAVVRKTLEDIRRSRPQVDWAKVLATTDADVARQIAEDPDTAPDLTEEPLPPDPRVLRAAAGMTQAAFAELLGVPLGTLRNWEQGRTPPEPGAQALFRLMARDLRHSLELLAQDSEVAS